MQLHSCLVSTAQAFREPWSGESIPPPAYMYDIPNLPQPGHPFSGPSSVVTGIPGPPGEGCPILFGPNLPWLGHFYSSPNPAMAGALLSQARPALVEGRVPVMQPEPSSCHSRERSPCQPRCCCGKRAGRSLLSLL